jgi:Putative Ig domain
MSDPTTTTTTVTAGNTASTLSFSHVLLLLGIVVGGMLLAGILVSVTRSKVRPGVAAAAAGTPGAAAGSVTAGEPGSVIRSWIAISLVMGLLVFCATAFLIDDASLRSTLYGGLIASVGAAIAFYFSSKGADQARADVLSAAVTMAQGGTPPTGFTAASPPPATSGTHYSYPFVANGQPTPQYILASAPDTVPPGLVLSTNGILAGLPTTPGVYTFTLRATNSAGSAVSPTVTMTVS